VVQDAQGVVGTADTLIFGARGLLGSELTQRFPDALGVSHQDVDITDRAAVAELILSIRPKTVINAAAYTDVDACEHDEESAMAVNGIAPGHIARSCEEVGAKMIHLSSDYVFPGDKYEYVETDTPRPINAYGRSKLRGEQEVRRFMNEYRIIRTSWLFGPGGKNFVNTMLRLSGEGKQIKVVDDQFGKPTYAQDLADAIPSVMAMPAGIYHVTNEGRCSWYDFAKEIVADVTPCSSEEMPRAAARPRSSALRNTRLSPMRHWKTALDEYLKEALF